MIFNLKSVFWEQSERYFVYNPLCLSCQLVKNTFVLIDFYDLYFAFKLIIFKMRFSTKQTMKQIQQFLNIYCILHLLCKECIPRIRLQNTVFCLHRISKNRNTICCRLKAITTQLNIHYIHICENQINETITKWSFIPVLKRNHPLDSSINLSIN